MILESDNIRLNHKPAEVFAFVSNPANLGILMPDQVINWKATSNGCSFTIQGMIDLELEVKDNRPDSFFSMTPKGRTPFPFTLAVRIEEAGTESQVVFFIDADLNPMMAMMARRPLLNLVQIMAKKLAQTTF